MSEWTGRGVAGNGKRETGDAHSTFIRLDRSTDTLNKGRRMDWRENGEKGGNQQQPLNEFN